MRRIIILSLLFVLFFVGFMGYVGYRTRKQAAEQLALLRVRAEERELREKKEQERLQERLTVFAQITAGELQGEEAVQAVSKQLVNGRPRDPIHGKLNRAALEAMATMPEESRTQVWTARDQELREILTSDSTLNELLTPDDRRPDSEHIALLADVVKAAGSDDDNRDMGRQFMRDLKSWGRFSEIREAALTLLSSDDAAGDLQTLAFDLLADHDAGVQDVLKQFQTHDEIPHPKPQFLSLAAKHLPASELRSKIDSTVKRNSEILEASYILTAVRRQADQALAGGKQTAADDCRAEAIQLLENYLPNALKSFLIARSYSYSPGVTIVTRPRPNSLTKGQLVDMVKEGFSKVDAEKVEVKKEADRRIRMFDTITSPFGSSLLPGMPESVKKSMASANAGRPFPLQEVTGASEESMIDLYNAIETADSDVLLETLLKGLSVRNAKVALAAGKRLTELLTPEQFPLRFFRYLSTRDEYAMPEVDVYVGFLTQHCKQHSTEVASALTFELKAANDQFDEVSWIKKVIALKALAAIGTSANLPAVKRFLGDEGGYTLSTTTTTETGEENSKTEIRFSQLAQATITEIEARVALHSKSP